MAGIVVRAVDHLAGSGVAFASAVQAGPWLFLTGHEAFDFAGGGAPEVEGAPEFPAFGAPRLKREAQYILARMRKQLAELGSDFRHSVRVDQYYPLFEAVRAYQLARHGEFGDYIPPSTSVLMERLFKRDSHISMSLIAVAPQAGYEIGKLYPKEVPVPVGSFFVPAITCNDFVFVAGQMASDENALDASVRLPKETRNWGGPNAVRRQTEFIIRKRLEPALKAGDSSWPNALKAQIYVPSAADIPDALDVWQNLVPHPCALTAVPTKGFGFVDGIVEINLLALRDGAKRRKEVLKDGNDIVGNRVRAKIIKNKVAPPFKEVEFDILYGQGISREGDLVDLSSDANIVEKSGAWFSFNGERIGQGRENAKQFLIDHPDIYNVIEAKVLAHHNIRRIGIDVAPESSAVPPAAADDKTSKAGRPAATA